MQNNDELIVYSRSKNKQFFFFKIFFGFLNWLIIITMEIPNFECETQLLVFLSTALTYQQQQHGDESRFVIFIRMHSLQTI